MNKVLSPRSSHSPLYFLLSAAILYLSEIFSAELCTSSESVKTTVITEVEDISNSPACSLCLEFTLALNSGNLTSLRQILQQNETQILLSFLDPEEGNTALMTAAFKNQVEVIKSSNFGFLISFQAFE